MYRSLFVLLLMTGLARASEVDVMAERRAALLEVVDAQIRELSFETGLTALSPATRRALMTVERHRHVPDELLEHAYLNRPLPIGHGQTISQPFIVALMTDLLDLDGDDRVLEIGTGSAYQAAVLAEIVDQVYTIEIIEPLANQAGLRLKADGHDNVSNRLSDGYYGWQEQAPFDAIIVTAAAGHVPPPLIEQLKPGGRLVIPVGSSFHTQTLLLIEKDEQGGLSTRQVLPVVFVPLTGEH